MKSFTALLLAPLVLAGPIATSPKWKRQALDAMDFQIVNLARNLESLELNYWNQGLDNFTDADFNNAGYKGFRTYLELFRDQEIAHFTVLNAAAGGGFTNCTYKFPVTNVTQLIQVGQVITSVGEGAFIGALGNLSSPAARQVAGEILGNEARQNSYLRQTIGLDFFNAVNFDTPLTASQAYSLAKPFLMCPSSNAPIDFKVIPPIMAAFADAVVPTKAKPGAVIDIMWDASAFYLGPDVHIQFLNDMYSLMSPLTQTGTGMGTTTLPAGINGTSFLVATNFQGGGPIPDIQNFGIGYLVVA